MIRRSLRRGASEPRLYQRAGGRQEKEGKSDASREEHQDVPSRKRWILRAKTVSRKDRGAPPGGQKYEHRDRNEQQSDMSAGQCWRLESLRHPLRIRVTRQRQRLEKHQAA